MAKSAPVIVFAYNRPNHLNLALAGLGESPIAKDSELFIFCDGPKGGGDVTAVEETRAVAARYAQSELFGSVNVIASEANQGLANSVISGVSNIINKYNSAIVVEDDLVTTPCFLEYMNRALDHYRFDAAIWSVSGYTPELRRAKSISESVYYSQRGCSWGWATWSDRWNRVDWEVSSYDTFKNSHSQRREFGYWGQDMPVLLDLQMHGLVDSWAIRWCYEEYRQGMYTVYPTKSLVRNTGMDGSGTHGGVTNAFDVELDDGAMIDCEFDDFFLDETLRKEFNKQYSGTLLGTCKRGLLWFLIRAGVLNPR